MIIKLSHDNKCNKECGIKISYDTIESDLLKLTDEEYILMKKFEACRLRSELDSIVKKESCRIDMDEYVFRIGKCKQRIKDIQQIIKDIESKVNHPKQPSISIRRYIKLEENEQ